MNKKKILERITYIKARLIFLEEYKIRTMVMLFQPRGWKERYEDEKKMLEMELRILETII